MSHILRTAKKKTRDLPSTHLSVVNCASAGTLPAEAESLRPLRGRLNKRKQSGYRHIGLSKRHIGLLHAHPHIVSLSVCSELRINLGPNLPFANKQSYKSSNGLTFYLLTSLRTFQTSCQPQSLAKPLPQPAYLPSSLPAPRLRTNQPAGATHGRTQAIGEPFFNQTPPFEGST